MSAFDKLSTKENYTDLESAIITFAFHERRARGDGEHPAAAKAATELVQLQDEHKFMSEQIDKLNAAMPCGHLARYAVNEKEGTQYCAVCNGDALFEAGKKALEYINKMNEFARACIRYAGNSGDDYLADKAREALGENNYE